MKYDILEVKKCDEKISKSTYVAFTDAKLIALCGVLIFACEKGLFDMDTTNVLFVGGMTGATLSTMSLVKSICNIYFVNERKKELKREDRRK